VLRDFDVLPLDRLAFGCDSDWHSKQYDSGEVRFTWS
jgi:hypothetical protein